MILRALSLLQKNLVWSIPISMTAFGQAGLTIALLIALAYVIQIQSAAWYVRMVDWIFGKTDAGALPQAVSVGKSARPSMVKLAPMPPEPKRRFLPAFQKILYVTDLSETARHAARYACGRGHTQRERTATANSRRR